MLKLKIEHMSKIRRGRGFPVELIYGAIMNCRMVRVWKAKVKGHLATTHPERMRRLCLLLMVGLLLSDVIMMIRADHRLWTMQHYSEIRPVTAAGAERRHPTGKAFGEIWDSLMADPASKQRWDSLLRLRPGLRDTLRQLERMDSLTARR
jgi:hypothetical protein